jgi:isopenicillin-N epimerase
MSLREAFLLAPEIAHLNHGGFGACPVPVLRAYHRWQRRLERHPSALLSHEYDARLRHALERLAHFAGCNADDLVFVTNTTTGLNGVARSLPLGPGDEVLATDYEYRAMDLLWGTVCAEAGARYVRAPLGLPIRADDDLADRVWSAVTPATRVLFLSHITSETAIRMPVADLCRRARGAGILTVVDGAHAPGHVPVDLAALGADAYAGSGHKWLCAPRGTGFLYVAPALQPLIRAPIVSHGSHPTAGFAERFRWQGTRDPCAFLAVEAALDFQAHPGWPAERARCHELARTVRAAAAERFGLEPLVPDDKRFFERMVSIPVPPCDPVAVRAQLLAEHRVDAPVRACGDHHVVRVSLQPYTTAADVERLLDGLAALLG